LYGYLAEEIYDAAVQAVGLCRFYSRIEPHGEYLDTSESDLASALEYEAAERIGLARRRWGPVPPLTVNGWARLDCQHCGADWTLEGVVQHPMIVVTWREEWLREAIALKRLFRAMRRAREGAK
jgi:hypothetical protein